MFGFWKVVKLSDKDSAGAERIAEVVSMMNENIAGFMFLPPYLRPNQCEMKAGAVVFGYVDAVMGKGAAFCGMDDADWGYFLDADYDIKKKLNVDKAVTMNETLGITKNITSTSGDVVAGSVSLKNHVHPATLSVSTTGTATEQTGNATGSTGTPT